MKDMLDKLLGKKKKETKKLTAEEERRAVLAKEKEEATKNKQPWVAVLDTKVNPDDIKNGFFELDWNNEFIEQLLDAGYTEKQMNKLLMLGLKLLLDKYLKMKVKTHRGAGFIDTSKIDEDKTKVS